MNRQTTESHQIGKSKDSAAGLAKQLCIGGLVLAIYNINGVFYATDDTCTHAFASLSEGGIELTNKLISRVEIEQRGADTASIVPSPPVLPFSRANKNDTTPLAY